MNHFVTSFSSSLISNTLRSPSSAQGAAKLDEWRADLMHGFGDAADEEVNRAIVFGYQAALLVKARFSPLLLFFFREFDSPLCARFLALSHCLLIVLFFIDRSL